MARTWWRAPVVRMDETDPAGNVQRDAEGAVRRINRLASEGEPVPFPPNAVGHVRAAAGVEYALVGTVDPAFVAPSDWTRVADRASFDTLFAALYGRSPTVEEFDPTRDALVDELVTAWDAAAEVTTLRPNPGALHLHVTWAGFEGLDDRRRSEAIRRAYARVAPGITVAMALGLDP